MAPTERASLTVIVPLLIPATSVISGRVCRPPTTVVQLAEFQSAVPDQFVVIICAGVSVAPINSMSTNPNLANGRAETERGIGGGTKRAAEGRDGLGLSPSSFVLRQDRRPRPFDFANK